jgi:ketosteroid isomerase-like protein
MRPAPEVRDLYLQFNEAFSSGDASPMLGMFSRAQEVLEIGLAPEAWSEGFESISTRLTGVSKEIAGASMESGDVQAFQEGTVAWLADQPTLTTPEGMKVSVRMTLVFHREGDGWKIVQSHISMGRRLTGS